MEFLRDFTQTAYRGFAEKFKYDINFIGVENRQTVTLNELKLSFAPTMRSIENLAIKISDGAHAYCYSGDGQFTEETIALYRGCDLVIQETYL